MSALTLAAARTIIAAAEKKADEIGQPMNIAVVDAGGNLISHVRQDGAWIGSIDISISKASGPGIRTGGRNSARRTEVIDEEDDRCRCMS